MARTKALRQDIQIDYEHETKTGRPWPPGLFIDGRLLVTASA
ncbi:hypothetical protein [Aeromonas caviae]|nr:hypothetical protein [Aeromonas caviae]MCX4072564.1 hypothetical protein [Aeromonas caviae]